MDDKQWLERTKVYRLSFASNKPLHSDFVVSATIVYVENDKEQFIQGTNYEPCWIGGSICAERCALMSLRGMGKQHIKVTGVYITSDTMEVLSPGVMCREFMFSSPWFNKDTKICMGNADLSQILTCTIAELYPCAFVFARKTRKESFLFRDDFDYAALPKIDAKVHGDEVSKVVEAAAARLKDEKVPNDQLVCCGAALLQDGTIITSIEKRFLEYANSLDAVTQLAEQIQRTNLGVLAICQMDCRGFLHAPFAPGRAYLAEYGHGNAKVACHVVSESGVELQIVKAEALVPHGPKLKEYL